MSALLAAMLLFQVQDLRPATKSCPFFVSPELSAATVTVVLLVGSALGFA